MACPVIRFRDFKSWIHWYAPWILSEEPVFANSHPKKAASFVARSMAVFSFGIRYLLARMIRLATAGASAFKLEAKADQIHAAMLLIWLWTPNATARTEIRGEVFGLLIELI